MNEAVKLTQIEEQAGAAAEFLRSLASEVRLMILCTLCEGECSVGELAGRLRISQPNVSQHLARLRAQGLVDTRRQGTTVYYRLADPTVRPIIAALYQRFCGN